MFFQTWLRLWLCIWALAVAVHFIIIASLHRGWQGYMLERFERKPAKEWQSVNGKYKYFQLFNVKETGYDRYFSWFYFSWLNGIVFLFLSQSPLKHFCNVFGAIYMCFNITVPGVSLVSLVQSSLNNSSIRNVKIPSIRLYWLYLMVATVTFQTLLLEG